MARGRGTGGARARVSSLANSGVGIYALLAALADPDWRVQTIAAETLGRLGDPAAVPPLLELLERETPESIYAENLVGGKGQRALYRTGPGV